VVNFPPQTPSFFDFDFLLHYITLYSDINIVFFYSLLSENIFRERSFNYVQVILHHVSSFILQEAWLVQIGLKLDEARVEKKEKKVCSNIHMLKYLSYNVLGKDIKSFEN